MGISLRDVLLFAGAALFCAVVIRFMLADSADTQSPEQPAQSPERRHFQRAHDAGQDDVVNKLEVGGNDAPVRRPDEAQPWRRSGRGDHDSGLRDG